MLKLLVSRVSITSPGAFSGEAVAYLENKELPISLTTLRKLSNHRDVSVRVFAYTRLNVDNAAERELLQSMALLEPVERVRTQLKEQLELLALGSQLEVAE